MTIWHQNHQFHWRSSDHLTSTHKIDICDENKRVSIFTELVISHSHFFFNIINLSEIIGVNEQHSREEMEYSDHFFIIFISNKHTYKDRQDRSLKWNWKRWFLGTNLISLFTKTWLNSITHNQLSRETKIMLRDRFFKVFSL